MVDEVDYSSLIEERKSKKEINKEIGKVFRGPKNYIEKIGIDCERLVIAEVSKGTSIADIVKILKVKYSDINWFPKTITNYIDKNIKLKNLAMTLNKNYAMQQAELNIEAQNKLNFLMEDGQEVLAKTKKMSEFSAYFSGLRTIGQLLFLRERLAGRIKENKPPAVQVNVVQAISRGKSDVFNQIASADFKIPSKKVDAVIVSKDEN